MNENGYLLIDTIRGPESHLLKIILELSDLNKKNKALMDKKKEFNKNLIVENPLDLNNKEFGLPYNYM